MGMVGGEGGIDRLNHVIKPMEMTKRMVLWSLMKCLLTWCMQGYGWVVQCVEKEEAREIRSSGERRV